MGPEAHIAGRLGHWLVLRPLRENMREQAQTSDEAVHDNKLGHNCSLCDIEPGPLSTSCALVCRSCALQVSKSALRHVNLVSVTNLTSIHGMVGAGSCEDPAAGSTR